MFDCTVIIITYQSADTVGSALRSLRPAFDSGVAECIVVDNASSDDTVEHVRAEHPWVRIVAAPLNLGYGVGCNLGLEYVRTPYVLFMNPDVQVDTDAIPELVSFARRTPELGLAGPALRSPGTGAYQPPRPLPTPWSLLRESSGRPEPSMPPVHDGDPPVRVEWVCGAALFAPTPVVRTLSGFDPRFFLYFEETDLCRRVATSGRSLFLVPTSVVSHVGAASTRTIRPELEHTGYLGEHYYPSRFYYLRKHHGLVVAFVVEAAMLLLALVRDAWRVVTRRKPTMSFSARLKYPLFQSPPRRDELSCDLIGKLQRTAGNSLDEAE